MLHDLQRRLPKHVSCCTLRCHACRPRAYIEDMEQHGPAPFLGLSTVEACSAATGYSNQHSDAAPAGAVSGAQSSLQSAFQTLSYAVGIAVPMAEDFAWLMAGSCCVVAAAAALYTSFFLRCTWAWARTLGWTVFYSRGQRGGSVSVPSRQLPYPCALELRG